MNHLCKSLLLSLFVLLSSSGLSQIEDDKEEDSLLDLIDTTEKTTTTIATFKSTRLVSGHSVETVAKGEFLFLIGHRFGTLNSGWRDLFGLDNATTRLGGDFGITDKFNAGIGRSSFEKTYDGFLKYKVLEQQIGEKPFPATVTLMANAYANTLEVPFPNYPDIANKYRWEYSYEAMIASKLSDNISVQVTPMVLHKNFVESPEDENTIFSGSLATSVKLTPSTRFNVEYYITPKSQIESLVRGAEVTNALSVGFDIETGGHVFQLHLTNSRGMTEKFLATETNGKWGDGDIFFGFNIARNFNIGKN